MTAAKDGTGERYAVLLRGVNVGGHAKVAMPRLREVLSCLGYGTPQTYLNSGNLVVTPPEGDAAGAAAVEDALGRAVEQAIEEHFGLKVACLARSGAYLRSVVAANPFAGRAAADGRLVHATFLSADVPAALLEDGRLASVAAGAFAPEDHRVGDRVVYLDLPGGTGRSRLAVALARPAALPGLTATTRNWNTVVKLAGMTAA